MCRSDEAIRNATLPKMELPRTPGHEVVGRIEAVGEGVEGWGPGDRAGLGWHGGHCGACPACCEGDFTLCRTRDITGGSFDGGYAEDLVAPATALVRLPEDPPAAELAPLLCAGLTAWNALRHCGARAGERVAIQGLGGIGHLALQYASRMGFETVAISKSGAKERLARELGAAQFIDTSKDDPAAALAELGGAKAILATAPDSGSMERLVGGLGRNGCLVVAGIDPAPLRIHPLELIDQRRSVLGWPSGHPKEAEEAIAFGLREGVRPLVETFPLQQAEEAWQRLASGRIQLRAVLLCGSSPDYS